MRRDLLALSAACLLPSLAAAGAVKWSASSTTALSITGDITVGDRRITFANGQSIGLKPVAGVPRLFTIEPCENPVLLNGNYLCGSDQPPAFVAFETEGTSAYLLAFDGPGVPKLAADPLDQTDVCALYAYGD